MKSFALISLLLVVTVALRADDIPPELPLPVASFGAAALPDGSLYFYGGHSGRRHKYSRDEVHGGLFRWKQGADKWETLAKDEPAQGASLVATTNGVIRIGGMAARNAKGEKQDLWSSETAAPSWLFRENAGAFSPAAGGSPAATGRTATTASATTRRRTVAARDGRASLMPRTLSD